MQTYTTQQLNNSKHHNATNFKNLNSTKIESLELLTPKINSNIRHTTCAMIWTQSIHRTFQKHSHFQPIKILTHTHITKQNLELKAQKETSIGIRD